MYFHEEAIEPTKSLLSLLQESPIASDMPMEITADGDLRITLIGEEKMMQRALTVVSDIVAVYLEKTGEYHSGLR